MKYFHASFDTRRLRWPSPSLHLYPIVCLHLGALQCDIKFLREHVARIAADPQARWVYMGDGGECCTRFSKGDVYAQTLSPQLQCEAVADLLKPVRDKGLFGTRGNHGHRVYKESGLSFDHALCGMLGIPYLGMTAFANFVVNRSHYDCYFHHGTDSGISLRSKIASAEQFTRFIDADALFTAHSHIAADLQPAAILALDPTHAKITTKMRHQYICGSAYDSRTGYAEEKGYPPLLPSYLSVAFDGRIIEGEAQKGQTSRLYRSDGRHELKHDYISALVERTSE